MEWIERRKLTVEIRKNLNKLNEMDMDKLHEINAICRRINDSCEEAQIVEKLKKLIREYQYAAEVYIPQIDKKKMRYDSFNDHGGYNLGYMEGRVSAIHDMVDELLEIMGLSMEECKKKEE